MRLGMTLVLAAGLLAGCGDKDGDTGTATAEVDTAAEAPDGEALYLSSCAGCHGEEGEGYENIGPALDGEFSRHDDDFLVGVVLNGDGTMPAIPVSEAEAYAIVEWLRAFFEGG